MNNNVMFVCGGIITKYLRICSVSGETIQVIEKRIRQLHIYALLPDRINIASAIKARIIAKDIL